MNSREGFQLRDQMILIDGSFFHKLVLGIDIPEQPKNRVGRKNNGKE
jgi:hypothetical protein